MTATTIPSGRRTAATWVGATGAFLLLAAAAVFVAVRWDQLPEPAKLAIVGGLTGAFLAGGRALRRTLPATGDVLFHLGAFLVPIDLAAWCVRAGVSWRAGLLAEGVVCVALFAALARATGSVVLERAAAVSVLALAAGAAGVSPIPATVMLAGFAVAAEVGGGRLRTPAALWAAVAGLAPALGAAAGWILGLAGGRLGAGTLGDLGLHGATLSYAGATSGVMGAFVLARQAKARRDVRMAFLAVACVLTGIGTSVTAAQLSGGVELLGLAGLFVVIEIIALAVYDDDFWGRHLAGVALVAEHLALVGTVLGGLALLVAPLLDPLASIAPLSRDWSAGAALLLVALGWFIADARRIEPTTTLLRGPLVRGGGWALATAGTAVSAAAAVELTTVSALATAVALVALAAAMLAADRAGAAPLAAAFVPWAVITAWRHPAAVPLLGVVGALALALAATRSRAAGPALAVEATFVGVATAFWSADPLGTMAAVCIAAATAWALSIMLDRDGRNLGDVARLGLAVPLAAALVLDPSVAVLPASVVTMLFVVDAIRLRRPEVGLGAAVAVQLVVASLARASGLGGAWTGFALCVCAVAWTGLAAVAPDRWRQPVGAAAGLGLLIGLALATGDGQALADSLLVAGGIGVTAGLALRRAAVGHAGGALAIAGLIAHLHLAGVVPIEPYVAPVAAHLLVAGWVASRRRRTSSWVAYAPAVALLGGAAFAERLTGGAGWHAVVAGAVGVAAVAAGGWRRQAGPMVVGTALLVALSVREALSTLAGVPTWGWLALGGSVLLAAAVLLERSDRSPLESGRRIVEVLADRFE